MKIGNSVREMNDDIAALVSEAKIRNKLSDEGLGKWVGLKRSSIQNYRSAHTFPNLPFWKLALIAKMAGYEIIFTKKGGQE